MSTREVRLEGGTLRLDGKQNLWTPDADQSAKIAYYVTDDCRTILFGYGRELRLWDITAEPRLLWQASVIPGVTQHVAVSADRRMLFALYDTSMWGLSLDVFSLRPHGKDYGSTLRLHLNAFGGRIEFGGHMVLWHDPAEKRWRVSEDGRHCW